MELSHPFLILALYLPALLEYSAQRKRSQGPLVHGYDASSDPRLRERDGLIAKEDARH
jgi:hypothetical protein